MAMPYLAKSVGEIIAAMMAAFRPCGPRMRGSVRFDNDTCFARQPLLRGMLSATTYFCDAYDTRHDVIADRGAHAAIPPRINAKSWKPSSAWCDRVQRSAQSLEIPRPGHLATMEWIPPPETRRDEDALRETAGAEPHGGDFDRQVAELHVRIAVLNGYTALGMAATEAVG